MELNEITTTLYQEGYYMADAVESVTSICSAACWAVAKNVIDSTGHDMEVLHVIERKADMKMNTPDGKLQGERSMWAEKAEKLTIENTREICTNVYVAGMSANAAFGGPRMGPIFGGMLLSGKKVAESILGKPV